MLNEVTDRDVWLTDLSSKKFYYRQSVDFFPMDWSEGMALLLSTGRFQAGPARSPTARSRPSSAARLVLQLTSSRSMRHTVATSYRYTGCDGAVTVYFERWGCGSAPSGSCTTKTWSPP